MYKQLVIAAVAATLVGSAGVSASTLKHSNNINEEKITICHRTNSATNPYVVITISKNAANGNGHDDHTHHEGPVASSEAVAESMKKSHEKWGDIIPAYTWEGTSYAGLNWTTEGQKIYNNKCSYPIKTAPLETDGETGGTTPTPVESTPKTPAQNTPAGTGATAKGNSTEVTELPQTGTANGVIVALAAGVITAIATALAPVAKNAYLKRI